MFFLIHKIISNNQSQLVLLSVKPLYKLVWLPVVCLELTERSFAAEGDAVFIVKLQDYTATEKDEVTLDCELNKDVPVTWYHDDKEITGSRMVVIRSEGTRRTLVLKKVEDKDKGKYVCDCGTDKTAATINIEGKRRGN